MLVTAKIPLSQSMFNGLQKYLLPAVLILYCYQYLGWGFRRLSSTTQNIGHSGDNVPVCGGFDLDLAEKLGAIQYYRAIYIALQKSTVVVPTHS